MEVSLREPEHWKWGEFLTHCRHDFYHFPAYLKLSADMEGGRPVAAMVREGSQGLLLPLILRPVPDAAGYLDATSPYGYPGPLILGSGDASDTFVEQALVQVLELLQQQGVVSLFVRCHPVLYDDAVSQAGPRLGTLVDHGPTVLIDLQDTPEEMWRQTRSGHRNEINRLKHAGYSAAMDSEWEHEADFVRIYHQTMRRVGAGDYFLFSPSYFSSLKRALGNALHLCVVRVDGEIAAAGLFSETCQVIQYHLSGADDRFTQMRPTKLMLDFVRRWARERGNQVMHLGGGIGSQQDSLFNFKAGFSHRRATFRSWRCVIDRERYRELLQLRGLPEDEALGGFFPAYRQPLVHRQACS